MARRTLSGAPSSRSDKCTCTRPSRNRMVVFRLVKRRKRTSRKGIGARGRRARYSSANSKCNSEFTAFSLAGLGARKPSPFLFLFFRSFSSFFFSAKYFVLVGQHLRGRLMRALIRIQRRLAHKVVLRARLGLVQHRCPIRPVLSTTSLSTLRRSACCSSKLSMLSWRSSESRVNSSNRLCRRTSCSARRRRR